MQFQEVAQRNVQAEQKKADRMPPTQVPANKPQIPPHPLIGGDGT